MMHSTCHLPTRTPVCFHSHRQRRAIVDWFYWTDWPCRPRSHNCHKCKFLLFVTCQNKCATGMLHLEIGTVHTVGLKTGPFWSL